TDPVQECTPYWYPPSDKYMNKFPPTWGVASIVSGDTEAQNKWNSIKSRVPTTAPKGVNGDFTGVNYDYDNDPDCWWSATGCTTPKVSGIPADIKNVPEPLSAGYGFDDGPNCSHNAFYDYLNQKNQKATMFFVGSNVVNWPLEAQRALYDGHEMCAHSWSHNAMTSLTSEQAFAEVWYTIKAVTGVTVTCWRPPYGDTDDRIRSIVNALGLSTILWQADSFDWKGGEEVDTNYQNFINNAKGDALKKVGTIFLQHELNDFTMGKVMQYYPDMKSALKVRFLLVPVAVALNKTRPYVEQNIEFPSFNECVSSTATATSTSTSTSTSSSSARSSSSSVSSTSRMSSSSVNPSASASGSRSSIFASTTTASSSMALASASGSSSRSSSSASFTGSSPSVSTTASSTSATTTTTAVGGYPMLPTNPTKAQVQEYMTGLKQMFDSLMAWIGKM
ncbi:glycoside hydrolase/deacetylase, partial [Marasmius fiardii PR-910]